MWHDNQKGKKILGDLKSHSIDVAYIQETHLKMKMKP